MNTLLLRQVAFGFGSLVAGMCRIAGAAEVSIPGDSLDHAGIIRSWNAESLARGEKLYNAICITCHGNLTQAGSLPASRPFWKEPFKNGSDPLSIYKTLSQGLGQMPAWTFLAPEQRYDTIHYLRETFVKPHQSERLFQHHARISRRAAGRFRSRREGCRDDRVRKRPPLGAS